MLSAGCDRIVIHICAARLLDDLCFSMTEHRRCRACLEKLHPWANRSWIRDFVVDCCMEISRVCPEHNFALVMPTWYLSLDTSGVQHSATDEPGSKLEAFGWEMVYIWGRRRQRGWRHSYRWRMRLVVFDIFERKK